MKKSILDRMGIALAVIVLFNFMSFFKSTSTRSVKKAPGRTNSS